MQAAQPFSIFYVNETSYCIDVSGELWTYNGADNRWCLVPLYATLGEAWISTFGVEVPNAQRTVKEAVPTAQVTPESPAVDLSDQAGSVSSGAVQGHTGGFDPEASRIYNDENPSP
ncbi:hypothetical protein FRC12_018424, partial [Ceratobasidium sp. 428]